MMEYVLIIALCSFALGVLIAYDAKNIKSPDGDILEPHFDLKGNIKGFRKVKK